MAFRHGENVGGGVEDVIRDGTAHKSIDGGTAFPENGPGFLTGRGAFGRGNSGGTHREIAATGDGFAKKAFSHRAAACVSGANEEHVLLIGHGGGLCPAECDPSNCNGGSLRIDETRPMFCSFWPSLGCRDSLFPWTL
jgi:hypothetical protein